MCIGNGMEWSGKKKEERKKENERRGSSHREHRIHTLHVCQSKRKEVGRTRAAVNFEYFMIIIVISLLYVEIEKRIRSGGELFCVFAFACHSGLLQRARQSQIIVCDCFLFAFYLSVRVQSGQCIFRLENKTREPTISIC